jgi:hypothetical protein
MVSGCRECRMTTDTCFSLQSRRRPSASTRCRWPGALPDAAAGGVRGRRADRREGGVGAGQAGGIAGRPGRSMTPRAPGRPRAASPRRTRREKVGVSVNTALRKATRSLWGGDAVARLIAVPREGGGWDGLRLGPGWVWGGHRRLSSDGLRTGEGRLPAPLSSQLGARISATITAAVRADRGPGRMRLGLDQVRAASQLRAGGHGGVAGAGQCRAALAEAAPVLLVLVHRAHQPTATAIGPPLRPRWGSGVEVTVPDRAAGQLLLQQTLLVLKQAKIPSPQGADTLVR